MEGGRTSEQDYDEINMLLDEIPNVTSGPANSSSGLEKILTEEKKTGSPNLYNSPLSATSGRSVGYYGGVAVDQNYGTTENLNRASGNVYESHGPRVEQDESNLPDEKSLALAFEELSFNDGVVSEATTPYKFNETSPGHTLINNAQHPFGMDSLGMAIRQLNPSRNKVKMDGENNVKIPDYNGLELERQKTDILLCDLADQLQNFAVYPGAIPLNPGVHTCQPLPNVAVPGIDLATSPYQQQFYVDAMSSRNLGQPNISWQNLDEERFYGLHGQYLYQQLLQNNGSDLLQFGKPMNSAIRPLTGSQRQPFFEIPSNANAYWNDNALHKAYSQLDLPLMGGNPCQYHPHPQSSCRKGESYEFPPKAYSANDLLEWQVLDRVRKHYFPEKILTRSQGVNSLRSLRSDSIVSNQSSSFANKNGRTLSNGHRSHSSFTSNGSFKLDCQDSRCYLPDSSDVMALDLKFNSVDEVMGRIYYLAKDQLGCRFLQRKFTEGNPEDVGKIFAEIITHIVELMTDPFGNYLVQKLLEVCNEEQRVHILHAITGDPGALIRISCNMHGTRAVQKVIETLQTKDQISMVVSSLKPGIVSLMKDANGNHVAQRCLQYFSSEFSEFLYDAAIAHCTELAADRQGCCVLQKCIYYSKGDWKDRLVSEICSNSRSLSQNAYGNYVVQYVLDQKISWATAAVLGQLESNYDNLSTQKHSSNVVEKCLKYACEADRSKIIQELMNSPRFLQILQDPYGNYVIQSALKQCKGTLHALLVDAVKPHEPALRSSPYGKKVLSSVRLKK
ncbi:pumilio-like protein 12-like isoform X1 [Iris pallida]|uniref:Pumilio-like protein 12-like isoform X1 n=1 Tax=Iris pallida TaxID=29817 RepID=A0AAX6H723_IRIPA|nr:pumilio-like protein 12-like isoform X1 [Iris pallida]